jgi:hypothetical protein
MVNINDIIVKIVDDKENRDKVKDIP